MFAGMLLKPQDLDDYREHHQVNARVSGCYYVNNIEEQLYGSRYKIQDEPETSCPVKIYSILIKQRTCVEGGGSRGWLLRGDS